MTTIWENVIDVITDSKGDSDPRMKQFLMKSPLELLTVIIIYFFLIFFGPKFMQNRKPFSLRHTVIAYNIVQILLNLYIFLRVVSIIDQLSIVCTPWAKEHTPNNLYIVQGHYYFILLKYFDLVETVFFVLRKKGRQVSFLHVYHHVGTLSCSWIAGKYFPGGQAIFVALYNTLAHCIMYSYYLYTTWTSSQNVWWKKYVTLLQMIQHFLVFISVFPVVINKNCTYPKMWMSAFSLNLVGIIYLFAKFYKRTYLDKNKET